VELFRALLLPLAVFCIGLGVVLGGRAGHVLTIVGTVLAGFAVLFVLVEA
jgi:hypothetical protein